MKLLLELAVFGSLCLVVVTSHRFFRLTSVTEGPECTPDHPPICGDIDLIATNTTELTEEYGPNVCNISRTYNVGTNFSLETEFCYAGGFCQKSCVASKNCTGPEINLTLSVITCCKGFDINPEDEDSIATVNHRSRFSYKHRISKRQRVLKEKGCSLELKKSLSDCLLELSSTQFSNELVNFNDIVERLGRVDEESNEQFTLFVPNITALEGVANFDLQSHIVDSQIIGKKLNDFLILDTLSNTSIHFGKADKNFYANGVKITNTDFCRALNGVVHIVEGPIPQTSDTISDIINPQSDFSTFGRLLNVTGISNLLDVGNGKSRTVLAPTNEAFDALPAGSLECLLLEENRDFLNTLVLIHIGYPADYSATLAQRSRFYTFTYYYLHVRVDDDDTILVTNENIPLEQVDITASNGVIHGISQVIIPRRSPCNMVPVDA